MGDRADYVASRRSQFVALLGEDNVYMLRRHFQVVAVAACSIVIGGFIMIGAILMQSRPAFLFWIAYTSLTLLPLILYVLWWDNKMYRSIAKYVGVPVSRAWLMPLRNPASLDSWIKRTSVK